MYVLVKKYFDQVKRVRNSSDSRKIILNLENRFILATAFRNLRFDYFAPIFLEAQ